MPLGQIKTYYERIVEAEEARDPQIAFNMEQEQDTAVSQHTWIMKYFKDRHWRMYRTSWVWGGTYCNF